MSTAHITFTGDLLCYPTMTVSKYDIFFSRVKENLSAGDFLVGNLETPIAGEALGFTNERYCFNTPIGFIEAIKHAGFELLTLANNHCMDRGEEGILRTLVNCKNQGFDTIGLYETEEARNKTYIKEINGIKVAFINYTYGTNAFAHKRFLNHPFMVNLFQPEETLEGSIHLLESNEKIGEEVERIYREESHLYGIVKSYLDKLKNDIQDAKKLADYVVMVMHCGGQYNLEVDPYTSYIAERIKEYGADIIIGHHPHIIQKSKKDSDGYLTVYSLGDFIDDPDLIGPQAIDYTYNAVFHLTLEKDNDGIIAKTSFGLYKIEKEHGVPYSIDTYDLYRLKKSPELKQEILEFANRFAGEGKYTEISERYEL